jgi:hypothetical protein
MYRCLFNCFILILEPNENQSMMMSRGESNQSNGNRAFEVHRGDDFQKKLLFYENNSSSRRLSTQPSNGLTNKPTIDERMQRSKSYKDLSDPPIVHPVYTQHTIPTNVGNGSGLIDYQQRQALPDDMSSSSTGHLPKPPPGIPSQNAR